MRTLRKDYARYSKDEEMDDMVVVFSISSKMWTIPTNILPLGTWSGWRIWLEAGTWRCLPPIFSCHILFSPYWQWLPYHCSHHKCHSFDNRWWTVYRVSFKFKKFDQYFYFKSSSYYLFYFFSVDEAHWLAQESLFMLPRHQSMVTSEVACTLGWVASAGFAKCSFPPFLFHQLSAEQNFSSTLLRYTTMPPGPFLLDLW